MVGALGFGAWLWGLALGMLLVAMHKTFETTLVRDGSICYIPVPFDPKPVFGAVRAKVVVTLNGYSFRSTIAQMGEGPCLPLRKSHREGAGLQGNETLPVMLQLDTEERTVEVPPDLQRALNEVAGASERFAALSYTHRREHVEAVVGAKQDATRGRRIAAIVAAMGKSTTSAKKARAR